MFCLSNIYSLADDFFEGSSTNILTSILTEYLYNEFMEQDIVMGRATIDYVNNFRDVYPTSEKLLQSQSVIEDGRYKNETIHRYERVLGALSNKGLLEKITKREPIQFYEIRLDARVVGLGSLVLGQTIEHPAEGQVSGNEVDYFLSPEYINQDKLHKMVAEQLVNKGRHTKCDRLESGGWQVTINENGQRLHSRGYPVFSSVLVNGKNPAIGFGLLGDMRSAQCTANLDLVPSAMSANRNDILEVAKNNKPVEFFLTK
jgi:hypothetical protein